MEFTYERTEDGFSERANLIEWEATAFLERGKFLPLLYSWTTKKFSCTANFAVSSKSKSIAVISSDGELSIMHVKDDKLVLKSQVRVLSDPYPEFRLIEWNSTETLLFATRSSSVMDVFEASGIFLYKIPMRDEMNGSLQIISQIRLNSLVNDDNFSDDVFTLQIDGTFSAFRIGKEAYHRLFTVNLGPAPLCSMVIVPKFNILISCGDYQRTGQAEDEMESTAFGMNVHRILKDFPYVDCLKQSVFKKAWHERIPFLSDKKSVVICVEVSPEQKTLLAVTSAGDLLLFALPSLRLLKSTESYDSKTAPIQVQWITEDSFVVLHSNGQITQTKVNDYFNGIFENHEINLLENCKKICTTNDATTYALTEIRLDSIVTPEENKQRIGSELSLFVLFYVMFLFKFVKAFFSFFFGGDATRDLNEVLGVEQSAKLALYTTKSLSLAEYIEKCMYNRNYQLAISLAESSEDAFDLDVIYKRQWEDLKQSRAIKNEDLEVLRFVHDKTWVIEECLRLDVVTSLQLHEQIMGLAAIVSKSVENEKLQKRVVDAAKILAIVRLSVPRDEDACELYLRFRNSNILAFAFSMAEENNFELLNCLFEKHKSEFHNYLLLLLTAIPETTEPTKYAKFLPYVFASDASSNFYVLNEKNDFLPADNSKVPTKYAEYSKFLLGQDGIDEVPLFEKWCQQRVESIDLVSGLNEDCIEFLNLAIEHGCENLKELRNQYKLYNDFILFSASTTITFKQFISSDASSIQATLASHITRTKLLDSLEQTVQLIEFADKDRGKAAEQILSLVCAHSTRSFEILYELKKIRPNYLTTENLVQCFICSEVVGDELTQAMKSLGVPTGLVIVVEFCTQVKSIESPTFAEIHSAISDSNKATKLVSQFIHGSCVLPNVNRNDEWWRDLLSKSRQLRQSAFEKVVTDEQVLRFICTEMLNFVCRDLSSEVPPSRQAPFHLVVDLSGTAASANIQLLKQSTFEELIVETSREFLDSAIPDLDDANLKRASLVLDALRTGSRLPRLLANQKRALDVIKLSLELGSKRVPATFAYCNKEILLAEIVNTKNNYKNVKPCAELAKLLELTTPSARALSVCTNCALQREDLKTVKTFVQQLAKSSRDFAVVYELAKTILANNLDDSELNDDALACLIHNCPEDDLNTALEILSKFRNKKVNQKQAYETESISTAYADPVYTSVKKLHLFDFDANNTPLKIPLQTHQFDLLMSSTEEKSAESEQRINEQPQLRKIHAAVKVLGERRIHPFILENLNSQHYQQIAVNLANYKVDDDLDNDLDDGLDEEQEEENPTNTDAQDENEYEQDESDYET